MENNIIRRPAAEGPDGPAAENPELPPAEDPDGLTPEALDGELPHFRPHLVDRPCLVFRRPNSEKKEYIYSFPWKYTVRKVIRTIILTTQAISM